MGGAQAQNSPLQPLFQNKELAVFYFGDLTSLIMLTPCSVRVLPWNNTYLVQAFYQCMHVHKISGFTPGYATVSFLAYTIPENFGFTGGFNSNVPQEWTKASA